MRLYRGRRLSSAFLEKRSADMMSIDRSGWYLVKESLLSPGTLSRFHLSFLDDETQAFLDRSTDTSNSIGLQIYYSVMMGMLSLFMSKTSRNGALGRGGMFVFSVGQLHEFLDIPSDWNPETATLLDLGAGDGGVTAVLAEYYNKVYATEMSQVMEWRLRQRGFTPLPVDAWDDYNMPLQLISALNLLDRYYDPPLLLENLRKLAVKNNNCPVLLSLVLPVRPYVEFHPSSNSTKPDNFLPITAKTFEEQVDQLVSSVFPSSGFEVVRWTKLPYLCEGDLQMPYYVLSDAVFLLRPLDSFDASSSTANCSPPPRAAGSRQEL